MANLYELRNEHTEVINTLMKLESEIGNIFIGQIIEGSEVLIHMPDFIKKAILPHFKTEETVVFPLLDLGSPEEKKLKEELLSEHSSLRDCFIYYIDEMRKGKVSQNLIKFGREMCHDLATHAKKEDTILIPILRRWFNVKNGELLTEHAPTILFQQEETKPDNI